MPPLILKYICHHDHQSNIVSLRKKCTIKDTEAALTATLKFLGVETNFIGRHGAKWRMGKASGV